MKRIYNWTSATKICRFCVKRLAERWQTYGNFVNSVKFFLQTQNIVALEREFYYN